MEKTYTAKEIEKMLTLPCCHVSGMHNPNHYEEGEYICNFQIAEAFENLCTKLKINPKVKHKESCGWCQDYPEKIKKGDGKEYWDQPNTCATCGDAEYIHKRDNPECKKFVPCTFRTKFANTGEKK